MGEFLFLIFFLSSWASLLPSRYPTDFMNLASLCGHLVFILRYVIWVLRFEGVEVAVTQDLKGPLMLITPLMFHGRACSGSTMSITMVERRKMGNPLTHRFGCQAFVTLSRVTHTIWELSDADWGGFGGFVMEDLRYGVLDNLWGIPTVDSREIFGERIELTSIIARSILCLGEPLGLLHVAK